MNKQLKEKDGNAFKDVFPINIIQNIKDGDTGKTLQSILKSFNSIFVEYKNNVEDTRNSIDESIRRKGLWVTYLPTGEQDYVTEVYIGNEESILNNWADNSNWKKILNVDYNSTIEGKIPNGIITMEKLSPALQELLKQNNNIINYPDDEDLQADYGYLQFKDRKYNPDLASGKGYKILRKNWLGVNNVLTQDMINEENTIYIIRYDFDLNGKEIIIPEGCVLQFKGGSLSNGILNGNNTNIIAPKNLIFNSITIKGKWVIFNIYTNWFDFNTINNYDNHDNFKNLINLSNDNFLNNIYIDKGIYYTSIKGEDNIANTCMKIPSNTNIYCNGEIRLLPNNYKYYSLFHIRNSKNINIKGGKFLGDIRNHIILDEHDKGEWGHGVRCDGGNNIRIEDCEFSEFWGDGIDIIALYDDYNLAIQEEKPNNIVINNVQCINNGRQGISIEAGEYIKILNCIFKDTSNIQHIPPGAGIDIEPWHSNHVIKYITIDNCNFINNKMGFNISGNTNTSDIVFSNSNLDDNNCTIYNTNNIFVTNINSKNNTFLVIDNSNNIIVENSHFNNDLIFRGNISNIKIDKCSFEGTGNNWYGGVITFTKSEHVDNVQNYNTIHIFNSTFNAKNHYLFFINCKNEQINNIVINNNTFNVYKGGIYLKYIESFKHNIINYKGEGNLSSIMQLKSDDKLIEIINNTIFSKHSNIEYIFIFDSKDNLSIENNFIISKNTIIAPYLNINNKFIEGLNNYRGVFTYNIFDIKTQINIDKTFDKNYWNVYNNFVRNKISLKNSLHIEEIFKDQICSKNIYICIKFPIIKTDRLSINIKTLNKYIQVSKIQETKTNILYNNDFIKINPTILTSNFYYDDGINDIPAFYCKKDTDYVYIYINTKSDNINNLTLYISIDSVDNIINDREVIITKDNPNNNTLLNIYSNFIFGNNIKLIDNSIINLYDGMNFFDKTTNTNYIRFNNKWYNKGISLDSLKQGTTQQRPTGVKAGFYYFDTTLNKPIWKKEDSGTIWVDATGAEV